MEAGEDIPFVDLLRQMEQGALLHDATDRLRELVRAIEQAQVGGGRPKGTFTLSLEVVNESGVMIVRGAITLKKPQRPRPRAVFFATQDGDLTTDNPRQLGLPLDPPTVEVRDVLPLQRAAAGGAHPNRE